MAWIAWPKCAHPRQHELLQLAFGLSLSLLLLYGAFVGFTHASHVAEQSTIAKGLVVILALTWEITTAGSITNKGTPWFQRASCILLFLGYALLVAVTTFYFFPMEYREKILGAFDAEIIILGGIAYLGIPLFLAAYATRLASLLKRPV